MLRVHVDEPTSAELSSGLDELVAEGARRMLAAALEAEVDGYISSLIHEVDEHGRRLVVRNGHAEPRSLVTGAGPIEVRAPGSTTAASTPRPGNGCGSLGDPAAMGSQVPQGGRGAPAHVSPRDELG